jgi:hypothetical protein
MARESASFLPALELGSKRMICRGPLFKEHFSFRVTMARPRVVRRGRVMVIVLNIQDNIIPCSHWKAWDFWVRLEQDSDQPQPWLLVAQPQCSCSSSFHPPQHMTGTQLLKEGTPTSTLRGVVCCHWVTSNMSGRNCSFLPLNQNKYSVIKSFSVYVMALSELFVWSVLSGLFLQCLVTQFEKLPILNFAEVLWFTPSS